MRLFRKRVKNPRIIFDVASDGLRCHVELPELARASTEEATQVAQNVAATIHILSSGGDRGRHLMTHGLAVACHLNQTVPFFEYVMRLVHRLSGVSGQHRPRTEDGDEGLDSVVVPPSLAFTGDS